MCDLGVLSGNKIFPPRVRTSIETKTSSMDNSAGNNGSGSNNSKSSTVTSSSGGGGGGSSVVVVVVPNNRACVESRVSLNECNAYKALGTASGTQEAFSKH